MNNTYYHALALIIFTTMQTPLLGMHAPEEHKDAHPLVQSTKDIIVGSAAGLAEGVTGVPFSYFKNALQQGTPWQNISLNPRVFYRGFPVNAFCMVPTTAVQVAADALLTNIFPSDDASIAIARASAAGALSAATSTPTEMLVLHQQNTGTSLAQTTRTLLAQDGMRTLWRGMAPKAFRDAGFAAGFLTLYPRVKSRIFAATHSETQASCGAAITAGVTTACLTHPFDLISTRMQADPLRQKSSGMFDTIRAVHAQAGLTTFYKGLVPRTTRVIFALCIMGEVKDRLTEAL